MSESKAALALRVMELEKELAFAQQDIVALVQAIVDAQKGHPGIEVPDIHNRSVWRHVIL